jgi:hypothetical protein
VDATKGGTKYAQPVSTRRAPEEFARVKHQVTIRLVSDTAVVEAIKLTKLAVKYAADGRW